MKVGRYRLQCISKTLSIFHPQYRSRPLDTVDPKPTPPIGAFSPKSGMQSYGVDYRGAAHHGARPGPSNMLQKVSDSLGSQGMWTPDDSQDPEYVYKPIGDIKQIFSQGGPQQQSAGK
jgi:hypothetical protein